MCLEAIDSVQVFGLENRKAQLQLSMEEREHEIAVHTATLRAELKLGEEDRSKVTKEVSVSSVAAVNAQSLRSSLIRMDLSTWRRCVWRS